MAASSSIPPSSHHRSLGWQKSILNSDDASLIYSLPPGKPNTKIPLTSGGEDLRPRVDQAPQKGSTCFYYALNMLRNRIGPNPPKEHEHARKIEKCISSYRKEITQLNIHLLDIDIFKDSKSVHPILDHFHLGHDRLSIQKKLPEILDYLDLLNAQTPSEQHNVFYDHLLERISRAKIALKGFCEQKEWDNLDDYIRNIKISKYRAIHDKFFQALGIDPKDKYRNSIEKNILSHISSLGLSFSELDRRIAFDSLFQTVPTWEEFVKNNSFFLQIYFQLAAAEAYGFKQSDWTPSQPISSLLDDLKRHGPLYVGGLFGPQCYSKDPTIRQTIEGRSVYGWNPEDRLSNDGFLAQFGAQISSGHAIVIIGAAKGGSKGGYVYFVDPIDGSSVKDPSQQKIYVISYENLISNVSSLEGKKYDQASTMEHYRYALYFPKSR